MRLRITVLACALAAFAGAAAPTIAGAAPVHNRGLTIHAVPNHIIAGEAVLIYGQLKGPGHGGQVIRLYHRINPNPQFSLIGITKTNAEGQYEFIRPTGIVLSNRSWFVRGPGFTHSRTVHERVAALVSLASSSPTGLTRHPIVFSGHVTPDHVGSVVVLQEQKGSSDDWTTLKRGVVGPGSNYNISHAWRTPGAYDVRVVFRGDARNTSSPSDITSVVIQQAEVRGFHHPDLRSDRPERSVSDDQWHPVPARNDHPGAQHQRQPVCVAAGQRDLPGTDNHDDRRGRQLQLRQCVVEHQRAVPGSYHLRSHPPYRGAVRRRAGRGHDAVELLDLDRRRACHPHRQCLT